MAGAYIDLGNPVADHPLNKGLAFCLARLPNMQAQGAVDITGRSPALVAYNDIFHDSPFAATGPYPSFGSLDYDPGNRDTVVLNGGGRLAGGPGVTVAALVNITTSGTNKTIIVGSGFSFIINTSNALKGTAADFFGNTINNANGATALSLNTWHHIAVSWIGGVSVKVFLNGKEDGTVATGLPTIFVAGESMTLGQNSYQNYFRGRMANVWVWNRGLSPSEIAFHHADYLTEHQILLRRFSRRAYLFGSGGAAPPAGNRRRRLLLGAA